LRQHILRLYADLMPCVATALLEDTPVPYLDCVEVFHALANRIDSSYVTTLASCVKACSVCGSRSEQLTQHRELFIEVDTTLEVGLLHYLDQGYPSGKFTCDTCQQLSGRAVTKVTSVGDILLVAAAPSMPPPIAVSVPSGIKRTRGGVPSHLVLRAVLYHTAATAQEHFVVVEADCNQQDFQPQCHYDPLHGLVDGPPSNDYVPAYYLFSPVIGDIKEHQLKPTPYKEKKINSLAGASANLRVRGYTQKSTGQTPREINFAADGQHLRTGTARALLAHVLPSGAKRQIKAPQRLSQSVRQASVRPVRSKQSQQVPTGFGLISL
jgi:hypothetical protein